MTRHYPMLQTEPSLHRVTRGKRLVVLVGQRKALAIPATVVEAAGMAC
jgi:hypothetical protein